jgi:hypothetical protein
MTSEVYDFNNEADRSEARHYATLIGNHVRAGITSFDALKAQIFGNEFNPEKQNTQQWTINNLFKRGLIFLDNNIFQVDYKNQTISIKPNQ